MITITTKVVEAVYAAWNVVAEARIAETSFLSYWNEVALALEVKDGRKLLTALDSAWTATNLAMRVLVDAKGAALAAPMRARFSQAWAEIWKAVAEAAKTEAAK